MSYARRRIWAYTTSFAQKAREVFDCDELPLRCFYIHKVNSEKLDFVKSIGRGEHLTTDKTLRNTVEEIIHWSPFEKSPPATFYLSVVRGSFKAEEEYARYCSSSWWLRICMMEEMIANRALHDQAIIIVKSAITTLAFFIATITGMVSH